MRYFACIATAKCQSLVFFKPSGECFRGLETSDIFLPSNFEIKTKKAKKQTNKQNLDFFSNVEHFCNYTQVYFFSEFL